MKRTNYPIFQPREDYEINDMNQGIVFMNGYIMRDDEIFVYYGAADTTVCLAKANIDTLASFFLA